MEKFLQWSFLPFACLVFVAKILDLKEEPFWNGSELRKSVVARHAKRSVPRQTYLKVEEKVSLLDFADRFGFDLRTRLGDHRFLAKLSLEPTDRILVEKRKGSVMRLVVPLKNGGRLELAKESAEISVSKYDPVLISRERDITGLTIGSLFDALINAGITEKTVNQIVSLSNLGSRVRVYSFSVRLHEELSESGEIKSQIPLALYLRTSSGEIFRATLNRERPKYYDLSMIFESGEKWHLKPVHGKVTSHFSPWRLHPILGFRRPHPAVDISAPYGTSVKAVGSGVVSFAGWYGSSGNMIRINHGNKVETVYRHLSRIHVKKGQKVVAGETIGAVGSTGLSTGPHLCFSVVVAGKFVDPLKFKPFWIRPQLDTNTKRELVKIFETLKESAGRLQLAQRRISGSS